MAAQRNWAINFPVNLQVFGAGDLTLDLQACTQARRTARNGATEASGRG
jgi:hypothetical protein